MSRMKKQPTLRLSLHNGDQERSTIRVEARFDYNETLIAAIKAAGGWRWDAPRKVWYLAREYSPRPFDEVLRDLFTSPSSHPICITARSLGYGVVREPPLKAVVVKPGSPFAAHLQGGGDPVTFNALVDLVLPLLAAPGDDARERAEGYTGGPVEEPFFAPPKPVPMSWQEEYDIPAGWFDRKPPTLKKVLQVGSRGPAYKFVGGTGSQDIFPLKNQVQAVYWWGEQGLNGVDTTSALPVRRRIVAHRMGRGKTLTAVMIAELHHPGTRVIVVCPEIVRLHWVREFAKVGRRAFAYGIDETAGRKWMASKDGVLVVGYASISKDTMDKLGSDADLTYSLIIGDEAHYLKNHEAQRTIAFRRLAWEKRAQRQPDVLLLTGTPMLNRPVELFSPLEIVKPGRWKDKFWEFAAKFCDLKQTKFGKTYNGATNIPELRQELEGYMHRDIETNDGPALRRAIVPLSIDAHVRMALRRKIAAAVRAAEEQPDHKNERNAVLGALARVRTELWEYKRDMIVRWLTDALEAEPTRKFVVFTYHKGSAEYLADALRKLLASQGQGVGVIHGDVAAEARETSITQFQNNAATRVLIGTFGAMSAGVTLTAATATAFAEIDYVPGTMLQAEKRIHRIGQTEDCTAYYLVAADTLDESQVHTLVQKLEVIGDVIDPGSMNHEALLGEFNDLLEKAKAA